MIRRGLDVLANRNPFSGGRIKLAWPWRIQPQSGLAVPSLRQRAEAAYQSGQRQLKRREHKRYAQAVQRQRKALQRLLKNVLSVSVRTEAMRLPKRTAMHSYEAIMDWKAASVTDVSVCVDGLTFRACYYVQENAKECGYRPGGYQLEVELVCPACHDTCWQPVTSMGRLGYLLRQVDDGSLTASCPTCEQLAALADDPFLRE